MNCDLAIVGVIPARFAATRLPGKPLADIAGRPLVQHVFERARLARCLDRLVVATDDQRIVDAARGFGAEAVLTSPRSRTGSDRVAEAAVGFPADIVVNLQGDEPLLDPAVIDATVEGLLATPDADLATAAVRIVDVADMVSPDVVKVLVGSRGQALWFSRAPIPFVRVTPPDPAASARDAVAQGLARRHIGIYAFRRAALMAFAGWPSSPFEAAEGLEQLRVLEGGLRLRVVDVDSAGGPAVDTPQDLARVRAILAAGEKMTVKEPS